MNWHFASGGQHYVASASAIALPMNIRDNLAYRVFYQMPSLTSSPDEATFNLQLLSVVLKKIVAIDILHIA